MGALVRVDHIGELQITLANVLLGGCLGKHQHTEGVQVLPLRVTREARGNEGVFTREAFDVLRGRHVEEHVVRNAAVFRRVDDWLEIHIDGG